MLLLNVNSFDQQRSKEKADYMEISSFLVVGTHFGTSYPAGLFWAMLISSSWNGALSIPID